MASKNTTELLAQLRGIHLPETPAEPQSWPLILALTIIATALLCHLVSRYRSYMSWSKQACRELDLIKDSENLHGLQSTAALLKRIALTHDHDNRVKQLSGDDWLTYLDKLFETRYFSEGDGQLFGTAQYQKDRKLSPQSYKDIKALIKRKARSQHSQNTRSKVTASKPVVSP